MVTRAEHILDAPGIGRVLHRLSLRDRRRAHPHGLSHRTHICCVKLRSEESQALMMRHTGGRAALHVEKVRRRARGKTATSLTRLRPVLFQRDHVLSVASTGTWDFCTLH